jgi:hypothetical protein
MLNPRLARPDLVQPGRDAAQENGQARRCGVTAEWCAACATGKKESMLSAGTRQRGERTVSREQLALHPMHQLIVHVVTGEAERSALPGSRDTRITSARIAACEPLEEAFSYTADGNRKWDARRRWKFPSSWPQRRATGALAARLPARTHDGRNSTFYIWNRDPGGFSLDDRSQGSPPRTAVIKASPFVVILRLRRCARYAQDERD